MPKQGNMVAQTYTFCRRCSCRVEIGRVHAGGTLRCPHCGFEFSTSHLSGARRAGQGTGDSDDDATPRPPVGSIVSGLFRPSFYRSVAGRAASMLVTTALWVGVVRLGLWCLTADGEQVDPGTRVLLWNGLLFSAASSVFATLLGAFVASACGLTILRETSEGTDAISQWPSLLTLEGFGDSLYIVNSVVFSLVPGVALAWMHRWIGIPPAPSIGVGALIFFPIALLSSLLSNGPTRFFSATAWGSLVWGWPAWAAFYLASAMLFGVAGIGLGFAFSAGLIWGSLLSSLILTVAWLVYFRLLGRLAWYFTQLTPKKTRHGVLE